MSGSKQSHGERLAEDNKLTSANITSITKKLDKLDAGSDGAPWTHRTLELIAEQPGIVSRVLARQLNRDYYGFKYLINELRNLGLVYGLDVGYSITPRGRAFMKAKAG